MSSTATALEMRNPTYICPMGALLFDRRPMLLLLTLNITFAVGLFSANRHASHKDQQLFIIVLLPAGRSDASIRRLGILTSNPCAHLSSSRRTPPAHTL